MWYVMRDNSYEYWESIRQLRNESKEGFIQQGDITQKQHEAFMKKYSDKYFICECIDEYHGRKFVGFVGVIEDDIRIATLPEFRGKGAGKHMVNWLMEKFPTAFAKVKLENEASVKLFESCGFKKKYYVLERDE